MLYDQKLLLILNFPELFLEKLAFLWCNLLRINYVILDTLLSLRVVQEGHSACLLNLSRCLFQVPLSWCLRFLRYVILWSLMSSYIRRPIWVLNGHLFSGSALPHILWATITRVEFALEEIFGLTNSHSHDHSWLSLNCLLSKDPWLSSYFILWYLLRWPHLDVLQLHLYYIFV